MKKRHTFRAVFAAFLVLLICSDAKPASTREVDRVRDKDILDDRDFQIIDDFVTQAVRELVKTKDFSSIAKIRTVIISRKDSNKSSDQARYSDQFFSSAHQHILLGFEQAAQLEAEENRFKAILNLLILIDGLGDLRLADLAMNFLNDESTVIRYWVVHALTNPSIIDQLIATDPAALKLTVQIAEQLKGLIDQACPETLILIADFAAELKIKHGEELLLQIANTRIKKYANWAVKDEFVDGIVLKLLYSKLSTAGNNSAIARSFAQLYSSAIQRYYLGRESLNASQKQRLASVLLETEKSCISRLLGMPQTIIKKAVERNDYTALLAEHDKLLGDETKVGKLPAKLKFNYGTDPDGTERITPSVLPKPPESKISQ